jgi:hypothetical protein
VEFGALRALSVSVEETYVSLQAVFLHSVKGMSCTDKNTLLSVVLEGEITVKEVVEEAVVDILVSGGLS